MSSFSIINKRLARNMLFRYLAATILCIMVIMASYKDLNTTMSGLLGCVLVVVPYWVYVHIVFTVKPEVIVRSPHVLLNRYKIGVVTKFAITTALFVIITLCYKMCNFVALTATYSVVTSVNLLGVFLDRK
jgi:F0F1-type ATP synthase assembly protein I